MFSIEEDVSYTKNVMKFSRLNSNESMLLESFTFYLHLHEDTFGSFHPRNPYKIL